MKNRIRTIRQVALFGFLAAQRVDILVHAGDVKTGRVAERYRQYIEGTWR
jgi:hypothetical protein